MSFAQGLIKVLDKLPYYPLHHRIITQRRQEFYGKLGIDYLLIACGIETPSSVYPPTSKEDLLKLIDTIEISSSKSADSGNNNKFQTRSILYLFLDCAQEVQGIEQYFVEEMWIPPSEYSLVLSIWNFDQGNASEALKLLGEPWVDNSTEFLHEFFLQAIYRSDLPSIIAYISCYPELETKYAEQYVQALAHKGDLSEMLNLSRKLQDDNILREISRASLKTRQNAITFTQLPFSEDEWFITKDELLKLQSSNLLPADEETLNNIILVRSMHTGDIDSYNMLKQNERFAAHLESIDLI